jgi:cytochrome c556
VTGRKLLFTGSLAGALISAVVVAAQTVPPVVKARQDDMKAMSAAAKALNDFFLGKRQYDAEAFRAEDAVIVNRAGTRLVSRFRDMAAAPGSDARPEIAAERGKFETLASQLKAYADRVGAAAEDGDRMPQSMRMRTTEMIEGGPFARRKANGPDIASFSSEHAFHMMLQTCTACHAEFRERR